MHYDSANATVTDRMRIWYDGTEVTGFDTDTNPSASVQTTTQAIAIGAENDAQSPANLILHNTAFFSGTLPSVTDLRNSTTGKPISPLGQTGLYSLVTGENNSAVRDSVKTSTPWTNNGNVLVTTLVP